VAGLAQGGWSVAPRPARPSLARQRTGNAGGRRARARRHVGDGAAGQDAAGLRQLVAPFAFEGAYHETIYLASRTEQARDRRISAVRKWIVEAVSRAK
jgi:hypothetical protein